MLRAFELFIFFYLIYRLVKNIFTPARTVQPGPGPQGYSEPFQKKEGSVNISDIPDQTKRRPAPKNDDGEYIDYKEL